jgi:hypothetical protein
LQFVPATEKVRAGIFLGDPKGVGDILQGKVIHVVKSEGQTFGE